MPVSDRGDRVTGMQDLLDAACRFYEGHLNYACCAYLQSRYGLQPDYIKASRIGYAPPDGTALLLHLMDQGFPGDEIVRSGLVYRKVTDEMDATGDLFRGRIVFPYLIAEKEPAYFIARMTDETPRRGDQIPPKYVKQIVLPDGLKEPIFGSVSVRKGEDLIITEGMTDALLVLQEGRPCISPVTTAFKQDRINDVAGFCRDVNRIFMINDAEESGAGLKGAIKTGLALFEQGITRIFIGTLPRPEGVAKVDLNDFMRSGGDLDSILRMAIPADLHPAMRDERRRQWQHAATAYRSELSRQKRMKRQQQQQPDNAIEELKSRMPSLSSYTGIAPGKRGSHPVYGSTHGDNFVISADGETWTSFHGGNERGKSGDILKLIALKEGFLDDEGMPLRGEAFIRTVEYCRGKWGG